MTTYQLGALVLALVASLVLFYLPAVPRASEAATIASIMAISCLIFVILTAVLL